MVRKAALNKIGRFTKQDIREQCPSLSLSSVEGALRKMVASGELKREGAGKTTCYIRLKQRIRVIKSRFVEVITMRKCIRCECEMRENYDVKVEGGAYGLKITVVVKHFCNTCG